MKTYKEECDIDGCGTVFVGVTREDYVEHLRRHSDLKADMYDKLCVSSCDDCGIWYKNRYGRCPECEGGSEPVERGDVIDPADA